MALALHSECKTYTIHVLYSTFYLTDTHEYRALSSLLRYSIVPLTTSISDASRYNLRTNSMSYSLTYAVSWRKESSCKVGWLMSEQNIYK